MLNFNEMNQEEQISIIIKLARKALEAYSFENEEIKLIKHEMNTVFQVENENRQYVLRIHPPHWLSKEHINSEMLFLDALARETELTASRPVAAINGSFVQEIKINELEKPRCCVLLEWIEGKIIDSADNDMVYKTGVYLAKLHTYGQSFKKPQGFIRPTLDVNGLCGEGGMFYPGDGAKLFTTEQSNILSLALKKIDYEFAKLDRGKNQFGLIHGDFYALNIINNNGQIALIDFDCMGTGYYLNDIMNPNWSYSDKFEYLLKGYSSVRDLPYGINDYKEIYKALGWLMQAYWVVTRQDVPVIRSYTKDVIGYAVNVAKDYLSK